MSGNGNGNGKRNGFWNLAEHGILWKRVLDYTSKEIKDQAQTLVMQLQAAVQPADALQGLLLDRIAAGYLRKRLLLDGEASIRRHKEESAAPPSGRRSPKVVFMNPFIAPEMSLRHEALLDQAFHRDLLLLQKLQENGRALPASDTKNSKKALPGLVEAGAKSDLN